MSKQIPIRGTAALMAALAVSAGTVATAGASPLSQTLARYGIKTPMTTKQQIPAPKGARGATGLLTARLALDGTRSRFIWRLKFSHLSGRALSAELHFGTAGKTGGVALSLCRPCLVGASGTYKGGYLASAAFRKPLLHGGIYVTITTKLNPKGEIRGQIKATAAS